MKFHDPQRLVLRRAIRVLIAFPIAFALSTYVFNLGIGALLADDPNSEVAPARVDVPLVLDLGSR